MRTRSSKEFNAEGEESKDVQMKTSPAKKEKTPSKAPVQVEKEPTPVVEEPADEGEKPTYTEEDVAAAKQLFMEGKRHFLCGNMAEASDTLSRACEILGAFYGEDHRECADPYYFYGRALLDLARKEPDVVAGAVDGTCLANIDKNGQEAEIDDNGAGLIDNEGVEPDDMTTDKIREEVLNALDENAEELEKAAAKKAAGETNGAEAGDAATAEKGEDDAAMDGGDDDGNEEDADGADDKENKEEEELTADEVSNLQLSWEMLDLCRVILEKHNDKASQERLGDCRLALGEQAVEDEQYEKALTEYNTALDIYGKHLDADDRRIATTHYNIGTLFNLQEEYEKAIDAFKRANDILKMRVDNIKTKLASFKEGDDQAEKASLESDVKELEALISDIDGRVQDCVESRVQTEAAKEAMNDQKMDTDATEKKEETPVADASHLVRKSVKRISGGEDAGTDEPVKKAKLETGANGDTNGHSELNGEKNGAAESVVSE